MVVKDLPVTPKRDRFKIKTSNFSFPYFRCIGFVFFIAMLFLFYLLSGLQQQKDLHPAVHLELWPLCHVSGPNAHQEVKSVNYLHLRRPNAQQTSADFSLYSIITCTASPVSRFLSCHLSPSADYENNIDFTTLE